MDILREYFDYEPHFMTKHHLDSYNVFISDWIGFVVESLNPFLVIKPTVHVYANVLNPRITKSRYMPDDCRRQNISYAGELIVDIEVLRCDPKDVSKVDKKDLVKDVSIGMIPIMVHSNYCHLKGMTDAQLRAANECIYDHGGYFIIDGKEKLIVSQENNVTNKLFASHIEPEPSEKEKTIDDYLGDESDEKKKKKVYKMKAFMMCVSDDSVFPKTLRFWLDEHDEIEVDVPHIEKKIHLTTLFRALGVESDHEILQHITSKKHQWSWYRPCIVKGNNVFTSAAAMEKIAKDTKYKSIENLQFVLHENLFPNIQTSDSLDKAKYLGYVVSDFMEMYKGVRPLHDRDSFVNKRVNVTGQLLSDLFRDFYNQYRVTLRNKIDRVELDPKSNKDPAKYIPRITTSLKFGFIDSLKGNWGLQNDSTKQGIVQDVERISYQGFISHLRRVASPLDETIKMRKPHQLDGSQWGIMCPCESPDGASIGLLKNMSIGCMISPSHKPSSIVCALSWLANSLSNFTPLKTTNNSDAKIYVNNIWIGSTSNPRILVEYMKLMKQNAFIGVDTSVVWNVRDNRVYINNEGGRCCRPLINLSVLRQKKGVDMKDPIKYVKSFIQMLHRDRTNYPASPWEYLVGGRAARQPTLQADMVVDPATHFKDVKGVSEIWKKLVSYAGIIEYVDVDESNASLVAMNVKDVTTETTHLEIHPSTCLSAYTSTIPFLNHNQAPRNVFSGAQGKQAVGIYATTFAHRIDTASAVMHYPQRPIVASVYTKYFNTENLPNGENLIVAIATYTGYNQEDSIILNGGSVQRGMFNVSGFKTITSFTKDAESIDEQSVLSGHPGSYTTTNKRSGVNYDTIDKDGMPIVGKKIYENDCIFGLLNRETAVVNNEYTQSYRNTSKVADKTIEGTVDKVVTVDHVLKVRLRKVKIPELGDKMSSRHGQKGVVGAILSPAEMPFTASGLVPDIIINPHAFPSRMTIGHLLECIVSKEMIKAGVLRYFTPFDDKVNVPRTNSDEVMYNGITGEMIPCDIFMGPTYYYRLKHMVADKINYRAPDGKRLMLTKQPPQGRSNDGGLRIGEMETNALVAHGFGACTKESLMERSDKAVMGLKAGRLVNDTPTATTIHVPHSFRLLAQELEAMSIKMDITDFDGFNQV